MSSKDFPLNEPIQTFLQLVQASYGDRSPAECFDGVDPSLQAKHGFIGLARRDEECYPMYLCDYKDTAGKVHTAVSIKGLFGGDFGLPSPENMVQAAGAAAYHVFPESDVLPNKVKKVIDGWLEHSKIDTVVAHSGGNRIASIIAKHLSSKKRDVVTVVFNGQSPIEGEGIFNLRTQDDWLTPDAARLKFCTGAGAHTVGEGGHALKYFEPHAGRKLHEFVKDQKGADFGGLQAEASILEKQLRSDDPPSADMLQKAESFAANLEKAQKAERRKQSLSENVVFAAKVGSAIASGLETWQAGETVDLRKQAAIRSRKEEEGHAQELRDVHRSFSALYHTSRWASDQFSMNEAVLQQHLASLKDNVSEWGKIQERLRSSSDQASHARAALLEKKIAQDKRFLIRVLQGVSSACDVAALASTSVPPASAAFGVAGSVCRAGAAFVNKDAVAQELRRDRAASRLQHQAELFGVQEGYADARRRQHDQDYIEALHHIATNQQLPPWIQRKALQDQLDYWSQKQHEHANQKTELFNAAYLKHYKTLNYPPHIQGDVETDTTRKREFFAREGYTQTPEGRAWLEEQQAMSARIQVAEKALNNEKAVASIKDRGYRMTEYWANFWSTSDESTRQFAQALDAEVQRYGQATEAERQSILQTFDAFEKVAAVLGYRGFQRAAAIGRDVYTMADLSRYALTTAIPNMIEAGSRSGSFLQNIGGLPNFLTGYLAPFLQFAIHGIRIAQLLTEETLTPAKAERRTRQLEYLSEQLKYLQQSVSLISEDVSRQAVVIDEGFGQTLHSLRELSQGVKTKIRQLSSLLRETLHDQEYNKVTAERKRILWELRRALIGKNPEVQAQLLLAQAREAEADIASGGIISDNPSSFSPPQYSSLLDRNPSHHTATLMSLIEGRNCSLPNLQHYLQVVVNYRDTVQGVRSAQVTNMTKQNLAQTQEILLDQRLRLLEFIDQYETACTQAAKTQKSLLEKLRNRFDQTLKSEETKRLAKSKAVAGRLKAAILAQTVGASRFGLISAFANEGKPHLTRLDHSLVRQQAEQNYTAKKDAFVGGVKEVGKKAIRATVLGSAGGAAAGGVAGGTAGGVVGGILGAGLTGAAPATAGGVASGAACGAGAGLAVGAAAIALAAAAAIATGGAVAIVGNGARRVWTSSDWRKSLGDGHKELERLTQSSLSRLKVADKEGLIRWHLATNRKVHDLFINRVSFRSSPDFPFRDVYVSNSTGRNYEILTLCPYPVLSGGFKMSAVVATALISSADISQLPQMQVKSGHQTLQTDFLKAAKSHKPSGKFDQAFLDQSEWVPAAQPGLVPLAFPKGLVIRYEKDKKILAAQGYELTPRYSLKKEDSSYNLVLEFYVNKQKHSSIVLANFDEISVRSFGAPIVDNGVLRHEAPNLNEFLITAMYAPFQADVKFPGQGTVALHGDQLIAPVDLPFSGIYKLLEKEVAQHSNHRIQFDSKVYAGDDQVLRDQLRIIGDAPQLEAADPLEKQYKVYCQRYHVLKAMYALQLNVNVQDIDDHLFEAGLALPASGDLEDVYEQMACSPTIGHILDMPVEDRLRRLPRSKHLPFSNARAGLIGALAYLEDGAAGAGAADSADGKTDA